MKSIFDKPTRDALIVRIKKLDANCTAEWGKMSVSRMIQHCIRWEEMALGKVVYKRVLLGRIFGKIALRDFLGNENPIRRNSPTIPALVIKEDRDVVADKLKWLTLIDEYENFSNPEFLHPFFGKVNQEQTGRLAYKHIDHHLRQFNC